MAGKATENLQSRLARWGTRLSDLPSIALPTDYPRPASEKLVEARQRRVLDDRTSLAVARLALFQEEDEHEDLDGDGSEPANGTLTNGSTSTTTGSPPTPYHLLLASFVVLLHRFTGDNDLVIGTSSASSGDPLVLRVKLDPGDSFWSLVRKLQFLEKEAEEDTVPFEQLLRSIGRDGNDGSESGPIAPLFRVRFFDETDRTENAYLQSTSSTSDLTIFVNLTSPSSSPNHSTPSLRSSLVPHPAITISYNSLIFSEPRITHILDQLVLVLNRTSSHPLDSIGSIPLVTPRQKTILPNPQADLEWCGFRGAITDIFARNAELHPDKRCIVESLSVPLPDGVTIPPNKIRTFTYRQIHEASNVLAHHLIRAGIQREDVVTVYSTRNVDLVIAVMGVLKAGATFSVIGMPMNKIRHCAKFEDADS